MDKGDSPEADLVLLRNCDIEHLIVRNVSVARKGAPCGNLVRVAKGARVARLSVRDVETGGLHRLVLEDGGEATIQTDRPKPWIGRALSCGISQAKRYRRKTVCIKQRVRSHGLLARCCILMRDTVNGCRVSNRAFRLRHCPGSEIIRIVPCCFA